MVMVMVTVMGTVMERVIVLVMVSNENGMVIVQQQQW